MVTAVWDQRKKDYLDNFVPFIATMLESRGIRRIEADDVLRLCERFEDDFGLKIPYQPMQAVLRRCVRRHLLRQSQGIYTVSQEMADDLSFSRNRDDHVRRQNELLERFIDYAKEKFDREIVLDDAETALLDYLHRYDMDILFSTGSQSAIPDRPKSKYDRQLSYMLSRFAIDAHESRPDIFGTLSDIALGNVLTAAVLLDGYDWPGDTVRRSNIYLDSPIILRMIGTAGAPQEKAFCDFVSTLRAKGAKLWVFEHSKTEAMRILEGARRWIGSAGFNPELASQTALFFHQQGYTDSEIERFVLRLDDVLAKYHIGVFTQHPYMENRRFQVDESRLRSAIESC